MHQASEFFVTSGESRLPVKFRRNGRARRCILRLTRDGRAQVTLPHGVSFDEGRQFAQSCSEWLRRQLAKRAAVQADLVWQPGRLVLWRGKPEPLMVQTVEADGQTLASEVRLGEVHFRVPGAIQDLRRMIETYLRRLAEGELPVRVWALAARHGFEVNHVAVRNQRSRWGSCSPSGTISLNWRLIQCPREVVEYIVLHELAHLRHMNHSASFWREVASLCPHYHQSEAWLKTTGRQWFHFD